MLLSIENHLSWEAFNHVINILPDFVILSSGPEKSKDEGGIDEFLFFNMRFYLFGVTES